MQVGHNVADIGEAMSLVLRRAGKVQIHRARSVPAIAVTADDSRLFAGLLHIASRAPEKIRGLLSSLQIAVASFGFAWWKPREYAG